VTVLILASLAFASAEAYAGFRAVGAIRDDLGIVAVLTLGVGSTTRAWSYWARDGTAPIFGFIGT